MNTEILKQKVRNYFNGADPERIISDFEKMGYKFVPIDESPASPSEDKGGEDSVDEKNNEVLDVFKHYTKTDFKSPEVLQQLDLVIAEINEVMMGAKVDPEKMRIILSMNGVGDDFVKQHTPVGFTKYKDFFVAGMITGFLLSNSDKSNL